MSPTSLSLALYHTRIGLCKDRTKRTARRKLKKELRARRCNQDRVGGWDAPGGARWAHRKEGPGQKAIDLGHLPLSSKARGLPSKPHLFWLGSTNKYAPSKEKWDGSTGNRLKIWAEAQATGGSSTAAEQLQPLPATPASHMGSGPGCSAPHSAPW